ncbi:MAG: carboxymuconolactone decarboxylase family protein [Marinobacter sp.]|jgi:alkylhydroperoxidase family enzyme|nr:carboxymuconolactone decarboxylase family protein [Marinobacter sp.]
MARIPYSDTDQANTELKQAMGPRPPLNVVRMIAHAEPSTIGFLSLGGALLGRNNDLKSQLRELVIIRVGILCGSEYEVFQHKRLAKKVGISDDKVAALDNGPLAAAFDDLERKVLCYTDAVVRDVKADAATFEAVADLLSHRAMVELTLTIGFYMMVSRILENFEVELENDAGKPTQVED